MKPTLTPARIGRAFDTAARIFEVPRSLIVNGSRRRRPAEARQAVVAALYRTCQTSYPEMAELLRRDHSTLIDNVKKIEALARLDRYYADALVTIARAVAE